MLHRARELLVRQRTMVINALRGHCAELGLIVAQGPSKVEELVAIIEDPDDGRLPPLAREALGMLVEQLRSAQARIKALEATLLVVPSIYSIVPPNDGSALRHGHHFEPVDFVIDHGRGHHDAYSAGSCQRTYARACECQ